MAAPNENPKPADARVPDRPDEELTEETMASDGPIDKIKDALGKAVGSEGDRHGARDTDPGS